MSAQAGAAQRYLLTGGGTGGHVTPALAIAEALQQHDDRAEFLYVGVRGKAEEALVPRAGFRLRFVRSRGYPGTRNPLRLAAFLFALGLGVLKALWLVLAFRPTVIIATGGYVAAPVLFAATILRRLRLSRARIFLHEQNVALGQLVRLGARFSDRVGVSFAETLSALPPGKGVFVGYPVRQAAVGGDRAAAREALGLPADARVVFAVGGSQGARTINRAVVDALPELLADPRVVVIHGTGRHAPGADYDGAADVAARLAALGTVEGLARRYRREDFIHDIGTVYAAADVVVCRAGAGTLTEIGAQGRAAVVIPKANLPGDHQVANARALERAGAAVVLYEGVDLSTEGAVEAVDGRELAATLGELLADEAALARMAAAAREFHDPQTLERIRALVVHLAGQGPAPELPAPADVPPDRVLGLSSNALDHLLQRIASGAEPPPCESEDRLIRYKIDGYLASPGHIEQARGCRMVGLHRYVERRPVLERLAAGRRADGGFVATPLVRRDAFLGLGGLGVLEPSIVATLAAGLDDPYFEARTTAAGAVARLARTAAAPEPLAGLVDALSARLDDRTFEPRAAAARALGEVAGVDVVGALRRLYFDPVWMVRQAVFAALTRLVEREEITAAEARAEMDRVLITSAGYKIDYPLKDAYNRLRQAVAADAGEGD